MAFLEERIATQRLHAEIWWYGWLTFYAAGVLVQGGRTFATDDEAEKADLWISVIKATGGVIRYAVDPFGGIEELEPMAPGALSEAEKRQRVERGEQILVHNAEKTDAFGLWYAHALNITINLIGGIIVATAFEDPQTGFISAGIGAAVGEVALLTAPWEADQDLADYRSRFGGGGSAPRPTMSPITWMITPTLGGAALLGRF